MDISYICMVTFDQVSDYTPGICITHSCTERVLGFTDANAYRREVRDTVLDGQRRSPQESRFSLTLAIAIHLTSGIVVMFRI